MGCVPFDLACDCIDADSRINIQQEMHRIGHHFHLDDCIAVFVLLFEDQLFDPVVNRWNKHLPPVLRAKDYLVFVAILTTNICSVNPPGAKPPASNLQARNVTHLLAYLFGPQSNQDLPV